MFFLAQYTLCGIIIKNDPALKYPKKYNRVVKLSEKINVWHGGGAVSFLFLESRGKEDHPLRYFRKKTSVYYLIR